MRTYKELAPEEQTAAVVHCRTKLQRAINRGWEPAHTGGVKQAIAQEEAEVAFYPDVDEVVVFADRLIVKAGRLV